MRGVREGVAEDSLTRCGKAAYIISVIPTPKDVLPILSPTFTPLRDALRKGLAYAEEQQPDVDDRDPFFWSHSARFMARKRLTATLSNPEMVIEGWQIRPKVPNCGIHLLVEGLHTARVVRSLGGTTPPPGRNQTRQEAWTGVGVNGEQGQLLLARCGQLPPLSLIIDWQDEAGEPILHVGLPSGPWGYSKKPRLHWRVPMPEADSDFSDLSFEGSPDEGSVLEVDRAEFASGTND